MEVTVGRLGRFGIRRFAAVVAPVIAVAVVGGLLVARFTDGSDAPSHGTVDVGFLQDMIDHHDQANLLAAVALRGDSSPVVRNAALDVVASQRYEIGLMEGWLIEWGLERGAPDRRTMAWMGMGMDVTPAGMPGMATTQEIAALSEREGAELDASFLELMIEHHRGGLHMSDAAAESARNSHVRSLAQRMARNQRQEIRELQTMLTLLAQ